LEIGVNGAIARQVTARSHYVKPASSNGSDA